MTPPTVTDLLPNEKGTILREMSQVKGHDYSRIPMNVWVSSIIYYQSD